MSETVEKAWEKFWDSPEPDYEGIEGGFYGGWDAALEWAAGQVESVGCDCGGVPHADSCPVELAAKIREGAP